MVSAEKKAKKEQLWHVYMSITNTYKTKHVPAQKTYDYLSEHEVPLHYLQSVASAGEFYEQADHVLYERPS